MTVWYICVTVGSPVGCNAEEDVLCYPDDLYPDMDITVHEFGHSLHWLGFAQLWPEFQVKTEKDAQKCVTYFVISRWILTPATPMPRQRVCGDGGTWVDTP